MKTKPASPSAGTAAKKDSSNGKGHAKKEVAVKKNSAVPAPASKAISKPKAAAEKKKTGKEVAAKVAKAEAIETDASSAVELAKEEAGATQAHSEVKNKQKVLLLSSRGINHRHRHLLKDLEVLLPHCKKDNKLDSKSKLAEINEIAELSDCNNCIFFEVRKKQDLFMWISKTPNGPSAKFHVQNIHTMDELNLTGNCLKGSRPLLSFDATFDTAPHLQVLKEIFIQNFGTPNRHRKSKPFVDHVLSFSIVDNRIWFRNYQITKAKEGGSQEHEMVEIGPRFVMNLIRIFSGSFSGATLFENGNYVSPNQIRRLQKMSDSGSYETRKQAVKKRDEFVRKNPVPLDELEDAFEAAMDDE